MSKAISTPLSVPLTAVDETELLQKYDVYIKNIVRRYLSKYGIGNLHPFYEDCIVEAQMALLNGCRRIGITNLQFTAYEYVVTRSGMEYAVRAALARYFGMGGRVHAHFDRERTATFSDYADSEIPIEGQISVRYEQDPTTVDVERFMSTLTRQEKWIVGRLSSGDSSSDIGRALGLHATTVRYYISRIREQFQKFFAVA